MATKAKPWLLLILGTYLICSLDGCGYVSYLKDPFVDIPNFRQVNKSLYRGGKPNENGLRKLADLKVKTVISLQAVNEEERNLTKELGMHYISFPMSVYQKPEDELVMHFLSTALKTENQPVFVHCASGRDRTGAMIALYRVVVNGWGPKEAYKEAKRYGFWPYYDGAQLKEFIHQLKDKPLFFTRAKKLLENNE